MNSFVKIVNKASEFGWCTSPYCTTCGNQEVRAELKNISGDGGFDLAKQLSKLAPSEIVTLPNWEDCIRLAFFEILLPGPKEKILETWLCNINKEIYFADVILFYIIRLLPFEISIAQDWITKCISLAIDSKNESLVESLIWTLNVNVVNYPELFEITKQMNSSFKINKAIASVINNKFTL